jgi:hypothetical protein
MEKQTQKERSILGSTMLLASIAEHVYQPVQSKAQSSTNGSLNYRSRSSKASRASFLQIKMNGDTKLSVALASNPAVLDYVIGLNPHDFERLRNPLMRKVMPPRITLRRIANMAGIPEQELLDIINRLAGQPLEVVDPNRAPLKGSPSQAPSWMASVDEKQISWVDVLDGDERLADPMPPINIGVNALKPGEVIGVKHKWEPQPLFDIWDMRGLDYWTRQVSDAEWHIFVHKPYAHVD